MFKNILKTADEAGLTGAKKLCFITIGIVVYPVGYAVGFVKGVIRTIQEQI